MLVKDIILNVCDFLENKDLHDAITSGAELTEEQAEEVETYVNCLNLVRNEIATEFLPNAKLEKAKTNKGKVEFSSLSSDVIEVLSVRDVFGNSLAFDVFSDCITVNASEVEIKYNASPEKLDFESEFVSILPARVYAYGIVREKFFIQAMYEDANVWEARFKNSIQSLARKKNETVVARRRWL